MLLSRGWLIIALNLILLGQFISLTQEGLSYRTGVESIATILIVLISFMARNGVRLAIYTCVVVFLFFGIFHVGLNYYFFFHDHEQTFLSFIIGFLSISCGIGLYSLKNSTNRITNNISYLLSIVPIGYIILITLHDSYPIEANLMMFFIQSAFVVLIFLPTGKFSGQIKRAIIISIAVIIAIFLYYSLISSFAHHYLLSLEYLMYSLLLVWLNVKGKVFAPRREKQHADL